MLYIYFSFSEENLLDGMENIHVIISGKNKFCYMYLFKENG